VLTRRIDRVLFAASKADHLPSSSHDRLEAVLRLMTERAAARATFAGASVGVIALAAVRALREVEAQQNGETLACIRGIPMPGEQVGTKRFDGSTEVALFPGDLPPTRAACWPRPGRRSPPHGSSCAFVRRGSGLPPARPSPRSDAGLAARPPRRALQFLIGDRLE